jgi:hypothetical protein
MLQLNCVTHKIILSKTVFMTKQLTRNQTPAREKSMIRIPRDLYKTIKILAVTNDEEIGLLVENLLAIGLKEFKKNEKVAA